jgi:indolepyruvate ferredoxin oxidoreductase
MGFPGVALDDKYALERGRVFATGVQALARLPLLQRQRDAAAGLDTHGYVSGYRGSPLGGLDLALRDAGRFLRAHRIRFQPGVNEELAATAIWGTQQLHLFPEPQCAGIFALWYGKGPGVDRCGDVFKHANFAGTAPHGGVLVVAGDDHTARSSAVAHQSEHMFSACAMPVLAPASTQEYLDLGVHGWAMSRYSGCWIAMKTAADTVETSAVVDVDPRRVDVRIPTDFALPPGGVHLRWPDPPQEQERRMHEYKVYAALAYARANGLNHVVYDSPRARLGIITCGKAYLDVRQALDDLGIDADVAAAIGVRLYKVAMVWPLEAEGVRRFAEGLDEILVVEEKRPIVEYQLKEQLYKLSPGARPTVIGKYGDRDEWTPPHGGWLLPPTGDLTPSLLARVIAARLAPFYTSERIRDRLALIAATERTVAAPHLRLKREPWFCPGCPHNLSTRVPSGSCALAGVGCHLMAMWAGRDTLAVSQMGGEGIAWLGLAGSTGTQHVFVNMGDGTYYHSGVLAIRAAVAANVNVTYKILYNDAVAMTGGQPLDGPLDVPALTRQLAAEGVRRIVVLAREPGRYAGERGLAPGVEVHPREHLDAVQRELRATVGVTALVYDQSCAAQTRRRRKRGGVPDPRRRVFVNEAVCEGCGDCSVKSGCLAIVPVETEQGRKRAIDQSSCNLDYACLAGSCPALVTVEGGTLRKRSRVAADAARAELPEPEVAPAQTAYSILIAGIGGTGIVTLGALLGMAAHLEGKGVTVLDMTGLAQKGGAVLSHVRVAERQDCLHAARIPAGEVDMILAADLVVATGDDVLAGARRGHTRAVVNTTPAATSQFLADPDLVFPQEAMQNGIGEAVGAGRADTVDATRLTAALLGDSMATNVFLLGYACQKGLLPVSAPAMLRAIELNGVDAERNREAFGWGRRAARDPAAVARCAGLEARGEAGAPPALQEEIARARGDLARHQGAACAARYQKLVERVCSTEARLGVDAPRLAEAVARSYRRLLACKDEYEVARLYVSADFAQTLAAAFEGDYRVVYHFAWPFSLARRGTGDLPAKREYGAWFGGALRVLARLKGLRGTWLDPFRWSHARRLDRALVARYERTVDELLGALDRDNWEEAVDVASVAQTIRGFGPVRMASAAEADARLAQLLDRFRARSATGVAP